ncbi:MAG: 4Fe-4S binding protein [Bacteroidales bacterium]|nr:4Fe-4S binding protein [Bacteroidales bacterium]
MASNADRLQWLRGAAMLVVCFGLMMAVAVVNSKRLFGRSIEATTEAVVEEKDGQTIINTSELDVATQGFGGRVPVEIVITDGRIDTIRALPNAESPTFFNKAISSGLLSRWQGLTVDEALRVKADGVTGATYSSTALIANVEAGLKYAQSQGASIGAAVDYSEVTTTGFMCSLLVVIFSTIVPLFKSAKPLRLLQQLLNVGVLGFWTGQFLSYSLMVKFLAEGLNVWLMLPAVIMLVAAFIFPLFGRPNYYCLQICPFGSLQELAGRCCKKKLRMNPALVKWLDRARVALWCVLMLLLWLGVWSEWMANEIFSAFKPGEASWIVVVVAAAFVVLSLFVPRPFCRFVCPTGSLFKVAEERK